MDDDSRERMKRVLAALSNAQTSAPPPDPTTDPDSEYAGLPYWYPPTVNSDTFDLAYYLDSIPNLKTLLSSPQGRQALTYADPLLFALVYLPHHLRDKRNPTAPPTFADPHFDWCRLALNWALFHHTETGPTLTEPDRNAYISPRETGKTTWWFLIIPMWAAAHGHKEFAAAFAHAKEQAEAHLRTFKAELEDNRFLREDYPDLCRPRRTLRGQPAADRVDAYTANSGFTFRAKGIDSSSLGMKDREKRPDLLLLDDVEPQEAQYNAKLARDRLSTILETVIPLNIYASFVMVGTVTMQGSVVHQLVQHARMQTDNNTAPADENLKWIDDWGIRAHHYAPITTTATGKQRSIWPQKWPLEYLQSIMHTRSYAKNYANDPKGLDGDFWNMEDYTYGIPPNPDNSPTRTALFIDPSTTRKKTSDPTGLAIVTWTPPTKSDRRALLATAPNMLHKLAQAVSHNPTYMPGVKHQVSIPANNFTRAQKKHLTLDQQLAMRAPGRCLVEAAWEVKKTGQELFDHVLEVLAANPHIRRVVIEVTQGGDLWLEIFANCPVRVEVTNPREKKEVRFARCLEYYQKKPTFVYHMPNPTTPPNRPPSPHPNVQKLEEQQQGFPKMMHDDIADAAVTGILYFLEPKPIAKSRKPTVRGYA